MSPDGFTVHDEPPQTEPRPLFRELPPAPVFPLDALGALRPAAEAIHIATQAPIAICAQSVLAAATLAVQAHFDVALPGVGRRPLTGLFASVAASGERKSAVDRLALRAVAAFEEEQRSRHVVAMAGYRKDKAAYEAAQAAAKRKGKDNRDSIRAALDAIGSEPKPPPHPMLLVADPTPEALVLHLDSGRPWCGVFTAEGGLLIGGHAMNDDNRMKTGALFNQLWDGDPIRRSRVLTGTLFLPGRRCSAHVMMQQSVADRLLGDAMLGDIGTLARLLVVAPESTAGTRMWRERDRAADDAMRAYDATLARLLNTPPPTQPDAPDVLDPRPLPLTDEARAAWIAFHDAVEGDLAAGGELHAIRAFGSKMPEHAGRLAAVLAVAGNSTAGTVDADAMVAGIRLAQHYAAELLRLQGGAAIGADLLAAQRLLEWWKARPDRRLHLAAIYQMGPGEVRSAGRARALVAILAEHGRVRRLPAGTMLDGSPRKDAWELVA